MYQIHHANPNIEGVIPVEFTLKDGTTAYVVSDHDLIPDIQFDTVEGYHEWLNENIERPELT
jgi:hypothetical protein